MQLNVECRGGPSFNSWKSMGVVELVDEGVVDVDSGSVKKEIVFLDLTKEIGVGECACIVLTIAALTLRHWSFGV